MLEVVELAVPTSSNVSGEVLSTVTAPTPIPPEQVSLLAPIEVQPRGRPAKSTQRDPSLFETIGARVKRRRVHDAATGE
jgi:hypothetical protein